MKLAKCTLIALASLYTFSSHAEPAGNTEILNLSKLVSTLTEANSKACVYNNAVYSVGAIVHQKDITIQCVYQSHTQNGLTPGAKWEMLGR